MQEISKVVEDGRVYARIATSSGAVVLEKADPRFEHDAPPSVDDGTSLVVSFVMRDFDGEARTDSNGTLVLDVDGTEVVLPVANGRTELHLELHASITIEQRPPYLCDARMSPFTLEITP